MVPVMAMPVVAAPMMMAPVMTVPAPMMPMPMAMPAHLHGLCLINIGLRHYRRFDISATRGFETLHGRDRRQRSSIRTCSKHGQASCDSNQSGSKFQ
jgi:hypothetical protein